MNKFMKVCRWAGFVCGVMVSNFTFSEEQFGVEAAFGQAHVNGGGYENALAYDVSFTYTHVFSYKVGAVKLDSIVLDGANQNSDSYLDVQGVYLGAYETIDLGLVSLDLGGGAFRGKVEAILLSESVGRESEIRPFLNGKIVIPIAGLEWLSAHIDFKYIDNLAGANLSLASAGVRFSF